jgi:transposase
MSNGNAPWRNEELLRQKYVDERKTIREIADEFGCSKDTVCRWKKKFSIEREPPWRDKDTLERLYADEGLSGDEIAERLGCGRDPVYYHLDKFDIPMREGGQNYADAPWKDAEKLTELYHTEGLSTYGVADYFDVSQHTIVRQMENKGIERRTENQLKPPYFHTRKSGHEEIQTTVGDTKRSVFVHQLLAIAQGADPHTVFDSDTVCHHLTHIPWDNRYGKVEVMERGEHQSHHVNDNEPEIQ